MAETKIDSPNKIIKDGIVRLIKYTLSTTEVDIAMLSKEKTGMKLRKEILQKRKDYKRLLEECLLWMSEQ